MLEILESNMDRYVFVTNLRLNAVLVKMKRGELCCHFSYHQHSAHVVKLTAHVLMVARGLQLGHLTTLTDNEYA